MAEKAQVISLNFRTDRRNHIIQALSQIEFEFVDGIFFDNLDSRCSKYFSSTSLKLLSHGALGCAATHVEVLKSIAALKNDQLYLVLEDDIILSANFVKKLDCIITRYPNDCDIFFLGGGNTRKRDFFFSIDKAIYKVFNHRLGAYGYLIHSRAAEKILKHLLPIHLICGGFDTAMGILIRRRKINAYKIAPPIINVDYRFNSNIYNPFDPSKQMHPNSIARVQGQTSNASQNIR